MKSDLALRREEISLQASLLIAISFLKICCRSMRFCNGKNGSGQNIWRLTLSDTELNAISLEQY